MNIQEKMIIEHLKKARSQLKLSGDEVARKIGKSDNSFISRLENGKQKLSIEIINELCSVYQLNPMGLFSSAITQISNSNHRKGFLDNLEYRSEAGELTEVIKKEIKNILPILRKIGKVMKRLNESSLTLADFFCQTAELLNPSSIHEAGKLGKKVAIELRKHLNLGLAPITDIQNLVWHFIRVPICSLALGEKCWGIYNRDAVGNPLIIYSSSHNTKQRNIFTIAHELGHHFFFPEESSIDISNDNSSIKEKLSDSFAQELLVPIDSLFQYIQEEGLLLIDLQQKHLIPLCQYFKVSYSMILFVLYDNKLIGKEKYDELKVHDSNLLKSFGYAPEKYMADSTNLNSLLENLIAKGIRTGKLNYLFASEMLDITQQEVKAII